MLRKPYILALVALAGLGIASCNSESEVITVSTYESTVVDGFSLTKDDKVLRNLDSVFFSIDLTNARIFNADSLPKGTDVSRLIPKISTSSVGRVELIVNRALKGDTTYNYLESQKDSIDFTNPVTLRITAQNGNVRDYQIKVNVHRTDPDSMTWSKSARTELPTLLSDPTVQKTVDFAGKAVTLTADALGNACVAVAENPAKGWEMKRINLPADADVRSLTATTDALYILDSAGALYSATEPAGEWTATGSSYSTLYGGYDTVVLAGKRDASGNGWTLTSYPEGALPSQPAPAEFPVTGNSQLIVYSSEWAENPTAIMAGGITAEGKATGSTWAFDGSLWACINASGLPAASGITIVPYFAFKTSSKWIVSRETVLLAIGGLQANTIASRNVYISWNRGITWRSAASTMMLPSYISAFAYADALVFDSTIHASRSESGWSEMPDAKLPAWERIAASRAITTPTQWECPYIYLFGGVDSADRLHPDVWRGVINRLEYMPLY